MRRKLLVVALGIAFLVIMTFIGTVVTENLPRRPTPRVQTVQAGPYQVVLQVDPNPPTSAQPAALSLQIVRSASHQLVTNAHVTLESTMEAMDMGTERAEAQSPAPGSYLAHLQFAMSGSWQVRVTINTPGTQTATATFEITAQT